MTIRRIVPTVATAQRDLCRDFYCGLLGLRVGMDLGWIATYISPDNPTAQISLARAPGPAPAPASTAAANQPQVSITIEVDDVDRLHHQALARGCTIVYPLTDESWGVRRFALADPNGLTVNIMSHQPAAQQ